VKGLGFLWLKWKTGSQTFVLSEPIDLLATTGIDWDLVRQIREYLDFIRKKKTKLVQEI
jgi:hypothetical protein